ncbi:TPA: hypothetical protein QCY03_003482 [Bacillus tropicus]|nr:hypothetical protein [Bacillus tropicus]
MVSGGVKTMISCIQEKKSMVPLIIAPEASIDKIIVKIGKLLEHSGFILRSGTIVKGNHELVDLLYKSGPTNKSNRIKKLSKTFASYWQYNSSPFAILLLEDITNDNQLTSYEKLDKLKGKSQHPEPGTLRGLSSLTRHMYSYVHVPDEDIIEDVLKWAFPPIENLNSIGDKEQIQYWKTVQELLSSQQLEYANTKHLLQQEIVQYILKLLILSNVDVISNNLGNKLRNQVLEGKVFTESDLLQIKEIIGRLKTTIPLKGYSNRRLHVLLEIVDLILFPSQVTIINAIEISELIEYSGVNLHPSKFQLLISDFLLSIS